MDLGTISLYPLNLTILKGMMLLVKLVKRIYIHLSDLSTYRYIMRRFAPKVSINEAKLGDLAVVFAWFDQEIPDSDKEESKEYHKKYVAKCKKKILGFVRLIKISEKDSSISQYWLYSLVVNSKYRGMGIGQILTKHVIEQAKTEKADFLFLEVNKKNLKAIRLYKKLGFEQFLNPLNTDKPMKDNSLVLRKQLQ